MLCKYLGCQENQRLNCYLASSHTNVQVYMYIYIRIHIHVHVSQRVQDSVPVASHILCSESLYIHGTKLLTALDII